MILDTGPVKWPMKWPAFLPIPTPEGREHICHVPSCSVLSKPFRILYAFSSAELRDREGRETGECERRGKEIIAGVCPEILSELVRYKRGNQELYTKGIVSNGGNLPNGEILTAVFISRTYQELRNLNRKIICKWSS